MEQANATTFLIDWVLLHLRQHSLPVLLFEDGHDAFFRSIHSTVNITVCLTGMTSLLSKNSFSLVSGEESSRLLLRESVVASILESEGK